ncbi:MAG: hypothetical protein HY549_03325 [Elusimicrobia bacterium]|nr:hypothetical protein [Elusimicrobiota bacterium]
MGWAALLALWSLPACASISTQSVAETFVLIEDLERQQQGQDSAAIRHWDRRMHELALDSSRGGLEAVPALCAIALDRGRGPKTRLLAVIAASSTRDPTALPALTRILWDPSQPDDLRAAAASGVSGLGLSLRSRRAALCGALERGLSSSALKETLYQASSLGCDQPDRLEVLIRELDRPRNEPERLALRNALLALARSAPLESSRALLRLVERFPPGSFARLAAIDACHEGSKRLSLIPADSTRVLCEALEAESSHPEHAISALKLLPKVKASCHALARRFLAHPDSLVVTEAAESLALLGAREAKTDLERLLAHIHEDARFAPSPERDPSQLFLRLSSALKKLQ